MSAIAFRDPRRGGVVRSSNEPNEEGEGAGSPDACAVALSRSVNTQARADKSRRAAARIAEPLLAGLAGAGSYRYSSQQYTALARYLHPYDPKKTRDALIEGRFRFDALEFVRDKSLTMGPTTTIAEFARATGIPKQTVSWRIGQFGPRSIGVGKRKRYHIEDLEAMTQTRVG